MEILIQWLIAALAIMVVAYVLPGVLVDSFFVAMVVAVVLGFINLLVRPALLMLTLPINILTLGLFTFVINALMVLLTAKIVKGFHVKNFWWALGFSLLLSVVIGVLNGLLVRF